jgi:hypothetical protein
VNSWCDSLGVNLNTCNRNLKHRSLNLNSKSMRASLTKNGTDISSNTHIASNMFDGSKRLSFLDANPNNSEFSLANFDHRNSLIAGLEDEAAIKNLQNFSLNGDYENELNELRRANRQKKAHKEYLLSNIDNLDKHRKYVASVSEAREKYAVNLVHSHGEKSMEQSNFFTTKNVMKLDFFPVKESDNYDFLYRRTKTLQAYNAAMKDVIHEETTIGSHLKSIHISLIDDIVG